MVTNYDYSFRVLMLRNREFHKRNISIEREIYCYREKYPQKKPLILIDLMHLDKLRTGDKEESNLRNICGPDLSRLSKFESLLRFLRNQCKAELVFFVDGPHSGDVYEECFRSVKVDRKDERYANDIELIDIIERGEYHGQRHAPTDRILFHSIKTMAERYGTLWYALTNSRKLEIAKYAVEHAALAIIAKSSDYLLYVDKIQIKIWDMAFLDVNTMTVSEMDHLTVCRRMGLITAKQRRLMAALLPGSVMGLHVLGDDVTRVYDLVQATPAYITADVYRDIANRLFGTEDKANELQKACEVIYDTGKMQLSVQEKKIDYSYDVLANRTTTFTLMLNDLRYWESRDIDLYKLVVDCHGRMAGLVLKRAGLPCEPDTMRRMRIKRNHEEIFGYHLIKVVYPSFEVNVRSDDSTESISESNIECLKFVLDLAYLSMDRLILLVDNQPDDNQSKLLDYVTVYFMVQNNLVTSDMADVILLTIEQYSSDDEGLKRTPSNINMEAFHATFMYVRWRFYIHNILNICEFPSFCIDNETHLDGVMMQNLYQSFVRNPQSLQEYNIEAVRANRLHD